MEVVEECWVEAFAMKLQALVALAFHVYLACAAPSSTKVTLDKGIFVGTTDGNVNKYLGIPYAQPPWVKCALSVSWIVDWCWDSVGNLRYRHPEPFGAYSGHYDATKFGPSCTQVARKFPKVPKVSPEILDYLNNTLYQVAKPDSEDCDYPNLLFCNWLKSL